jgi:hypothetical protein
MGWRFQLRNCEVVRPPSWRNYFRHRGDREWSKGPSHCRRSGFLPTPSLRFYDAATMQLAAVWEGYVIQPTNLSIPNLRPGTYRMQVDFAPHGYWNWAPQWFDRASDPSQARILTIGTAQIVDIPVRIQSGATISGNVLRPGREAQQVRVYITRAEVSDVWGSVYTYDGDFQFRAFPLDVGRSVQVSRGPYREFHPADRHNLVSAHDPLGIGT